MENPNDPIGNRTRSLSTSSAVPKPTALPIQILETSEVLNPLNAELNPICHLLALLGAHHILHVSGIRVNNSEMYKLKQAALVHHSKHSELKHRVKNSFHWNFIS